MFLKKYINNISGLQAFQLIRFGTLLLISIVLAKSHLSTESIGQYEFFLFLTALFCSFWINGLIQAFLPLYRNNNTFNSSESKSPEIFNAFILISLMSVLTALILLIFKAPLAEVLGNSEKIPYLYLIVIYILFSSPSFLIEYIYLLKNQPEKILIYGIITFTAQFLLVSLPVIFGFGIEKALSGLILISIVRYVWLIGLLKKYSRITLSVQFIREHIYFAWPLIISTLLGSSASYVDGFLVLNKFDSATFAVFRYGAKEFPLVLLMANALSTAMISEFSKKEKLAGALAHLRKKSANLMHLLFPATLFFLVFSHWLYPKIFNPDFSESAVIFNIYLLLIISRLVFPHTLLIGMKKTNIVMYASLAELILNVVLSISFIRIWGVEGVAFATVIAFAFQKAIWIVYNKTALGISPKDYIPLKTLSIYSFITLVVFFFMY